MTRENIYNGLLGITVIAMLLTGYNALVSSKDKTNPTAKLGSYLKLTQAKQESVDAENMVAGTDNTSTGDVAAPTETTPSDSATTDQSQTTKPVTAPSLPGSVSRTASTYVVKEGDTYGCIAEKYYGSFENWVNIDSANPDTEGFLERRLFVGAALELPALTADQARPASTLCQ